MRLASFQPLERNSENLSYWDRKFEEYLGYIPIFCFPAQTADRFVFGGWYSSPSISEVIMAFDTNNYRAFDLVRWNRLMADEMSGKHPITADDIAQCFENVDPRYAELVIPEDYDESDVVCSLELSEIGDISFAKCQGASDEEAADGKISRLIENCLSRASSNLKHLHIKDQYGNVLPERITLAAKGQAAIEMVGYLLYRILFDETVVVPFDLFNVSPSGNDALEGWQGKWLEANDILSSMYNYELEFTYERFDRVIECFSQVMSARAEDVARNFVGGGRNSRNAPCPCGSGRKFKKCHGGVLNVRPTHL